jgi:hypothetical protein
VYFRGELQAYARNYAMRLGDAVRGFVDPWRTQFCMHRSHFQKLSSPMLILSHLRGTVENLPK